LEFLILEFIGILDFFFWNLEFKNLEFYFSKSALKDFKNFSNFLNLCSKIEIWNLFLFGIWNF